MILKRLHLKLGKKAMDKLISRLKPPWKAAACAEGGYLEPFVLLEPPAHNPGCCLRNRLDRQLRNVCLIFRVYGWLQSLWTPWTPFAPPLEPMEYTAESRDRTGSQHDIQCSEPAAVARGQKCGAGVKSLRTAGDA